MKKQMSNTYLKIRSRRKTSPAMQELLVLARKHPAWNSLATRLSGSTRLQSSVNLSDLEKHCKEGDTIIVPGRVLGSGELNKKLRICALGFSQSAKDRLKKSKSEVITIAEEIKKNPKATGVKVLG